MRKGYTHTSVVLDRSGLMQSCENITISGFNEFLDKQKNKKGYATSSKSI